MNKINYTSDVFMRWVINWHLEDIKIFQYFQYFRWVCHNHVHIYILPLHPILNQVQILKNSLDYIWHWVFPFPIPIVYGVSIDLGTNHQHQVSSGWISGNSGVSDNSGSGDAALGSSGSSVGAVVAAVAASGCHHSSLLLGFCRRGS